jgi:hypothetical protein
MKEKYEKPAIESESFGLEVMYAQCGGYYADSYYMNSNPQPRACNCANPGDKPSA